MRPEGARTRHCDQTGSGVLLAPKTQRGTAHLESRVPFRETTQPSDCQGPSAAHRAKQAALPRLTKIKPGPSLQMDPLLHGFKIAKSCNAWKIRRAAVKSGNTCVRPRRPRGTRSPPTVKGGGQGRSGPPSPQLTPLHLPGARSSRAQVEQNYTEPLAPGATARAGSGQSLRLHRQHLPPNPPATPSYRAVTSSCVLTASKATFYTKLSP